jgi:hypothetical protein
METQLFRKALHVAVRGYKPVRTIGRWPTRRRRRVAKATGIVCGAEQAWRMTREACCRTSRGGPKHTRLQNTLVWMAVEMGGSGQASGQVGGSKNRVDAVIAGFASHNGR